MFKSIKINLIFFIVIGLIFFGSFYIYISEVKSQAANITLTGYAWSENIGWIDFSPATTNGGVIVGSGGNLTGYAWSENIGWIKFGGLTTPFPTDTGTLSQNAQIVLGKLVGWVRACAGTINSDCSTMTSRTDGWDGWISLGGANHSISLNGVDFSGFAWGSDNIGWIDFSGVKLSTLAPITISFSGTPTSVASGNSTNIYWSTSGADSCEITKNSSPWATSSSAYIYVSKFGSYGTTNGLFYYPYGIAVNSSGNIYVVDWNNRRVQIFNSSGTFISKFGSYGAGDGQFAGPADIAIDSIGNIYVTEYTNRRVQKFDSSGTFISKFGSPGSGDGQFSGPGGIAVDSSGNIYVVDNANNRVEKFNSSGTFISKFGSYGSGDGQLYSPWGIKLDSSGNIYIADRYNNRIQKFDSSGTFISKFGSYGSGDGQFAYPEEIAFDSLGNIYVADTQNNRIQKFDSSGTFISKFGSYGTGNGQFNTPKAIAFDSSSNVYITEMYNNRVQKFSPPVTNLSGPKISGPIMTPTTFTATCINNINLATSSITIGISAPIKVFRTAPSEIIWSTDADSCTLQQGTSTPYSVGTSGDAVDDTLMDGIMITLRCMIGAQEYSTSTVSVAPAPKSTCVPIQEGNTTGNLYVNRNITWKMENTAGSVGESTWSGTNISSPITTAGGELNKIYTTVGTKNISVTAVVTRPGSPTTTFNSSCSTSTIMKLDPGTSGEL
jgi:DNA-binding beta-propeller fold protein YncE